MIALSWSRMARAARSCGLALGLIWTAAVGVAQTISSVRVVVTPPNRAFYVDGQYFTGNQTFLWSEGSKHVLTTEAVQEDVRAQARYIFGGWNTNLGVPETSDGGRTISLLATPRLTQITLNFSEQFLVSVSFFDCPGSPQGEPCPGTPGTVSVGGARFTHSGQTYLAAGTYSVVAIPNPGWTFVNFSATPNQTAPYLGGSINVTGPMGIYARFAMTRRIRIESTPPGLQILVDRAPATTPYEGEWGRLTEHALDAPEAQEDRQARIWVFDSWSTGAVRAHTFTVPEGEPPITFSARFVRGERVTVQSQPAGVPISVDGRPNVLSPTFWWAVGSEHSISAPPRYVDPQGRIWVFQGWSQGGESAQTVTVPNTGGLGTAYLAHYESRAPVTVQSTVPGLTVLVDGVECPTPCRLERQAGQSVVVSAPQTLPAGEGARLYLSGWDPGGSAASERTFATTEEPLLLTAVYRTQFLLTAGADPLDGARFQVSPASDGGYYDEQTVVQVTAAVQAGFRFSYWDGDASGLDTTVSVGMFGPRTVRAILTRIPAIPRGGVRNGADPESDSGVAAGSAISIFGSSLAGSDVVGPQNPLVQTLGDVTVRVGSRILPLYFISPGQINAQLPSDLAAGSQTLIVRWEGQPETTADFTVVRNAPGIFQNRIGDLTYGLILNAGGIPITPDTPVRRGDTVTILATGLGPYLTVPPDGFGVQAEGPNTRCADPVEVLVGADAATPIYAGAAEGRPGIDAVRFRLADTVPSGNAQIRIQVGGKTSNTVLLPVQ